MGINANLDKLSHLLRLSPYQTYVLQINYYKYNLSRLVKRGGVLYAPYSVGGGIGRRALSIVRGVPADLIGPDRMLVHGCRRIRFYATGCYSAVEDGAKYYADANGRRMARGDFARMRRAIAGR